MEKKLSPMRWVIWTLAVLFFFYEYFLRVYPSVMVDDLLQAFSINAGALGALSAFYFYAYAPMQIPVGMLMDRYGARRLLSFAGVVCGLGSLLFGLTSSYEIAASGRFLMGIGSSFAFVGIVFVCSHWFEHKWLALLVGIANSVGMLGAIVGEGPLSILVDHIGWHATMYVLAIVGAAIGVLIYLVVRNEPAAQTAKGEMKIGFRQVHRNLMEIIKGKYTWVNAIGSLFFFLTTVAFAGLWADPFLQTVHLVSREEAAFISSMIFVGWIIGGPVMGLISDRIQNRRLVLRSCTFLALLALLPVIYMTPLDSGTLFILFFFIGLFSGSQLLTFSLAIEYNSPESKGTAAAFTNFIIALGGAILQPGVGVLMDYFRGTAKLYSAHDYQMALTLFPISLALAFILFLFLKPIEKK